jgi:hypothetical protein
MEGHDATALPLRGPNWNQQSSFYKWHEFLLLPKIHKKVSQSSIDCDFYSPLMD